MKKELKKVFSAVIACGMLSSTFTAFASTVEITNVEVMSDNNTVVSRITDTTQGVELTPEQILRVTVDVKDAPRGEAYVSYLSNKSEGALSNETIQYVSQETVENGSATKTVTFRPRATVGEGTFVFGSGATGATTAATFNYTVKESDKTMIFASKDAEFVIGSEEPVKFTVTGFEGDEYNDFEVLVDETKVSVSEYTIVKNDENQLVLSINASYFANVSVDDKFTITLKHDGYKDAIGTVTMKAHKRPEVVVQEVEKEFNEAGSSPARAYTGTFTPGGSVSMGTFKWTVTKGNETKHAELPISGTIATGQSQCVVGLVVVSSAGFEGVEVTGEFTPESANNIE